MGSNLFDGQVDFIRVVNLGRLGSSWVDLGLVWLTWVRFFRLWSNSVDSGGSIEVAGLISLMFR